MFKGPFCSGIRWQQGLLNKASRLWRYHAEHVPLAVVRSDFSSVAVRNSDRVQLLPERGYVARSTMSNRDGSPGGASAARHPGCFSARASEIPMGGALILVRDGTTMTQNSIHALSMGTLRSARTALLSQRRTRSRRNECNYLGEVIVERTHWFCVSHYAVCFGNYLTHLVVTTMG